LNNIEIYILVDKHGKQYTHIPGVITMFKSNFKAAMFSYYELDIEDDWQLQEVVVCDELFDDSFVNFID
jgi:hypothetical protein